MDLRAPFTPASSGGTILILAFTPPPRGGARGWNCRRRTQASALRSGFPTTCAALSALASLRPGDPATTQKLLDHADASTSSRSKGRWRVTPKSVDERVPGLDEEEESVAQEHFVEADQRGFGFPIDDDDVNDRFVKSVRMTAIVRRAFFC